MNSKFSLQKIFFLLATGTFFIFYFFLFQMEKKMPPSPLMAVSDWKMWCSLVVAIPLSLITTMMIHQMRVNVKFWEAAEELEKKIKAAKTKTDLRNLHQTDFFGLRKLVVSNPHLSEMKRLLTVMETKIEFLPGPPAPKAEVI